MKISNNWLKEYINTDLNSIKISEYLTDIGLEVEGVEKFENIKIFHFFGKKVFFSIFFVQKTLKKYDLFEKLIIYHGQS